MTYLGYPIPGTPHANTSGRQRIGRCSICGGDVMAHSGAWFGTVPPPPPTCAGCNAVEAASDPVIPMAPAPRAPLYHESPYRVTCDRPIFGSMQPFCGSAAPADWDWDAFAWARALSGEETGKEDS